MNVSFATSFLLRIHFFFLFSLSPFVFVTAQASKDTVLQPTVLNITSTFKPTLLENKKIPLLVESVLTDTFKINLTYSNQYQLNTIKSLPYEMPRLTPIIYKNEVLAQNYFNVLKIGYGSAFRSFPTIDFNIENGNGENKNFAVGLSHYSLQGDIQNQYQHASKFNAGYVVKNKTKFWNILLNAERNEIGLFNVNEKLASLRHNEFYSGGFFVDMATQNRPIQFHPQLALQYNRLGQKAQEINMNTGFQTNYYFSNPYYYKHVFYSESELNANYDMAWNNDKQFQNMLLAAQTKFVYKKNSFHGHVGIKSFASLHSVFVRPLVAFSFKIAEGFQLGLGTNTIAQNQNLLQYFHTNTFIADTPLRLFNTTTQKFHIDLNGSFNNRFYYLLQASLNYADDAILFKNDTNNVSRFLIQKVDRLKSFSFLSELKYHDPKFQLKWTLRNDNYLNYGVDSLWGIPIAQSEIESKLKLYKQLFLTLSYQFFIGNYYLKKEIIDNKSVFSSTQTSVYHQLNIGTEWRINKHWGIWVKGYNLFNQRNDRWGNYQELPIHVVGGIEYHFVKKPIF